MRITILGCGGAGGVPLIGNVWGNCDPNEPRNRRTRVSALVEEGTSTLLLDTSPDMREQLLKAELKDLTAILYTHAHADHTHGIDNIRSVNWLTGHSIPVYGDATTIEEITQRFSYIFSHPSASAKFIRPSVVPHVIEGPLTFGDLTVRSFTQMHGKTQTLGYRINDFGYSTDASALDEAAFEALAGVRVWVVGAIREKPHPTHAHVDLALEWIERIKPEKAYLTHMDHSLDYATLKSRLPKGIEPAYDGLVIEC